MDFVFNLARVTGGKQCNASAATFLSSLEDICSRRENNQFMRREGSVNLGESFGA
jgi:hypothetical protein